MKTEPTITVRGIRHSPALDADVRARIDKLGTCCDSIVACHVLIERAARRHAFGNRFHVRIDLTVPDAEIVIAHDPSLHRTIRDSNRPRERKAVETSPERKDAHLAIRHAFDAARRRLQDFAGRRRDSVRPSGRPAEGEVVTPRPPGVSAGDGR